MISLILNLPHTAIGLLVGLFSVPEDIKINKNPVALIFRVKSFWWTVGYIKSARAVAIGHVVLLSQKTEPLDLEHELIHVRQHNKYPLIFPLLYNLEVLRKGIGPRNKYEEEAYRVSGNVWREK